MRECVRAWGLEPERREVLERDISSQTSDEVVFIPGLSDDSSQRNRREEDHQPRAGARETDPNFL